MKHKECMEELRSICLLFGPPNMWQTVVREQAAARKRRKDFLDAQAAKRDRVFYFITVSLAVIVFGLGTGGLLYGAAILAENKR